MEMRHIGQGELMGETTRMNVTGDYTRRTRSLAGVHSAVGGKNRTVTHPARCVNYGYCMRQSVYCTPHASNDLA